MQEVPGYRIEGVAGRGGWSVVYRAVQLSLGRPVALKVIAPELARDEEFRARFRRECEIAASLDHPHVIPVYDAGEAGESLFVAMRWVDGHDLRALAPLEPARAARIISQVAGALDAAHARGLVHRDVKPGNVLVEHREDGDHAYLTDFGLTKEISSDPGLTEAGRWLGTVEFAAPEQIRGRPPDARSDVYSLGCVLGFAVTGTVPFPRATPRLTMQAHMHEPVPLLPFHLAPLNPVMWRALAKHPAQRFESAGALGQATLAAAGFMTGAASPAAMPSAPASGDSDQTAARAVAIVMGIAVLFFAVILAIASGGGDDDVGDVIGNPTPLGSVVLMSLRNDGASGTADVSQEEAGVSVHVQARLELPEDDEVYVVWLYDSPTQAYSLGLLEDGESVDEEDIVWTGGDVLPPDWREYRYVDVSVEESEDDSRHSGQSVLRGDLTKMDEPPE